MISKTSISGERERADSCRPRKAMQLQETVRPACSFINSISELGHFQVFSRNCGELG